MVDITYNAATRVANINTPGTTLQVDVSDLGTQIADVIINGYEFDVALADVTIKPLVAHTVDHAYNYIHDQINAPNEVGFTLGTGTSLEPLDALTTYSAYYNIPIGFTYQSIIHASANGRYLYKINLLTDPVMLANLIDFGASIHLWSVVVYNDETVYATARDATTLSLIKISLCTNAYETLYSINEIDGNYELLGNFSFMVRCKYDAGSIDCLVLAQNWYDDTGDNPNYFVRVIIYDLDAESVIYDGYSAVSDADTDNDWSSGARTNPAIHQDKVVFTAILETPYPLPATYCYWPTFVIDCSSRSVTRVDSVEVDPIEHTDYYWPNGAGIDRTTGIYYFIAYSTDDDELNGSLIAVNLASLLASTISTIAYADIPHILQGDNHVYAVKEQDNPTTAYSIPSLASLGTAGNPYRYGHMVDEKQGRLWVYNDTKLEGIPLNGIGANREVTINWSGGSTPFDYASSRYVWLFLMARKAFVIIYSTQASPSLTQSSIYQLQAEISC